MNLAKKYHPQMMIEEISKKLKGDSQSPNLKDCQNESKYGNSNHNARNFFRSLEYLNIFRKKVNK